MMDSLLQYEGDFSRLTTLEVYTDANNNGGKLAQRGDKYSLRPRSLRRGDDDESTPVPSVGKTRHSKPKQKPAPLSKYRRKTANARERSRMREINAAFEALRRAVPHLHCAGPSTISANEKLTKITTLRLAMKYISTLSAVLRDSQQDNSSAPGADLGELLSDCSDLDCLLLESDGESLPLSENSILASPGFSDSGLSPCTLEDTPLPGFLHTDFSENAALTTTEFSEFFLT